MHRTVTQRKTLRFSEKHSAGRYGSLQAGLRNVALRENMQHFWARVKILAQLATICVALHVAGK